MLKKLISNIGIFQDKSTIWTALLSIFLFWISLGIGENMSDSRYWVTATWQTIKFEWILIIIYISTEKKLWIFREVWDNHRTNVILTLLWFLSLFVSYLNAPSYSYTNPLALMRLVETISHIAFFMFVWHLFNRYKINYKVLFLSIIVPTLLIIVYFVYIKLVFPELEADRHVFSIRSELLLINTHFHRIGYEVETVIVLTAAFLYMKHLRWLVLIILLIEILFLLWLGGRASILGLVSLIPIMMYLYKKRITLKLISMVGIVLLSLTFVVGAFDSPYFINMIQRTFHAPSLNALTSGRIEVWSLALNELQGYWLLGTGPQSYFFYLGRSPEVIHAHNVILQFIGEWGIIGTSLFLVLFYKGVLYGLYLYKGKTDDTCRLTAGLIVLALSVTSLFSGIYFTQQSSVYVLIMMAIWISSKNHKQLAK